MFCTNCGRQLPVDGTPCVCGSGQREPVQAPVVPPVEVVSDEPVLMSWDDFDKQPEPQLEPVFTPVEPQPEPVYAPVEPQPEPVYAPVEPQPEPVFTPVEPQPEPVYAPVEPQPEPVYAPVEPQPEPVFTPVEPQPEPVYAPVEPQPEPVYVPVEPQPEPVYAPVEPQPAPVYQNPYPQAPVYAPPVYTPAPAYAVQGDVTPAKAILGQVAQSPLFMIAVIVVSVQLLMGLISSFFPADPLSLIHKLLETMVKFAPELAQGMTADMLMADLLQSAGQELVTALSIIRGVMIGFGLVSQLFPTLIVAALWLIFTSAKKKSVPTAGGFTILQVVQVFGLIGAVLSILVVLSLVLCVIALGIMLAEEVSYYGGMGIGAAEYFGAAEGLVTMVITLIVVLVLCMVAGAVLNLIYSINLLGTVVGAKKVLKTGTVTKKASMFVVIWNFLLAAGALGGVFNAFVFFGALSGIASLCSVAAYVLFSLCILQYNKAVKPLLENTAAPAVPAAPPAPYGY